MPGCQQETTACPFASALFWVMTEMVRWAEKRRTLAMVSAWVLPTYVLSPWAAAPMLGLLVTKLVSPLLAAAPTSE